MCVLGTQVAFLRNRKTSGFDLTGAEIIRPPPARFKDWPSAAAGSSHEGRPLCVLGKRFGHAHVIWIIKKSSSEAEFLASCEPHRPSSAEANRREWNCGRVCVSPSRSERPARPELDKKSKNYCWAIQLVNNQRIASCTKLPRTELRLPV